MEDKFGLSHHKLEEKHVSSNISKRGFNPQRAQIAEIEKGKQVLNDATNGQLKKLEDKYLLSLARIMLPLSIKIPR